VVISERPAFASPDRAWRESRKAWSIVETCQSVRFAVSDRVHSQTKNSVWQQWFDTNGSLHQPGAASVHLSLRCTEEASWLAPPLVPIAGDRSLADKEGPGREFDPTTVRALVPQSGDQTSDARSHDLAFSWPGPWGICRQASRGVRVKFVELQGRLSDETSGRIGLETR